MPFKIEKSKGKMNYAYRLNVSVHCMQDSHSVILLDVKSSAELLVLTAAHPSHVVGDIFHADAELLYNSVPHPPFAFQAIEQDPVLIVLLEVLPNMIHLLRVTGVANFEDL